jgi:ATP-dependent DNA helicase PIF1
VTASTGIAAIHVNGTTLHSMAGLRMLQKMEDFENMLYEPARERWEELEVLLIDEVSMLSAELFSALERGARHIRGHGKPWGGIQLVMCGDFHQLPPIVNGGKGKAGHVQPEARAVARVRAAAAAARSGGAYATDAPRFGAAPLVRARSTRF